ncbi:reductase [Xylariaceae sp. FL0016]|nr:reductase [Xylariaceae sp. FL0016]
MAKDLVLLTGGTGFLGYSVLVELLKSGYRVRAAVRSASKINQVLDAPSIKSLSLLDDDLSFFTVPDMAASGAYETAIQGVQYVVHVASPIPTFGNGEPWVEGETDSFVERSKQSVLNILESAKTTGNDGVRRVVMTSSTVVLFPFSVVDGDAEALNTVYGPEDRQPVPPGPYQSENEAYVAGKRAAIICAEEFMKTNGTSFDMISILPSWIFGAHELVTDAAGLRKNSSNALLVNLLSGSKNNVPYVGSAVLCSDAAKAHVGALDPCVEGGQSFIVNTPMEWETAIAIAQKKFPDAFHKGHLRDDGKQPSIQLTIDSAKSRKVLGLEMASYDIMVGELMGQYLQYLNTDRKG